MSMNISPENNRHRAMNSSLTNTQTTSGVTPSTKDESEKAGTEWQNGINMSFVKKQLADMIERAFSDTQQTNVKAEMSYHDDSSRLVITLWNKDTGEMIREIPSEKTLDLMDKMNEIRGIIIDKII